MIDPTIVLLANATVEKRLAQELNKIYQAEKIVGPKGDKGDRGEFVKGDKGDRGEQGLPGEDGKDGRNGKDGQAGIAKVGPKGIPGQPGRNGLNGRDGKDGRGISFLNMAPDGNLVVQFDDGKAVNLGQAQINNITNVTGGGGGIPADHFVINAVSVVGSLLILNCNNGKRFEVTLPSGGGGVTDGDKGDIVVSGGGVTWNIDTDAVTNTKLANMPATSIKANISGISADPIDATPSQIRTLINVADGATANSSDASLRDRSTHTGTQLAATISDFSAAVGATAAVTANTAKVTNANHTGDASGATVLTLATVNSNVGSFGSGTQVPNFTVNGKGLVTAAANTTISIPSTAISDSTAAGRALITATNAAAQTALFDLFTSSLKGLVPASGGGTTNFLRADGTWAAAGGGSPVTVQDEGSNITTALATLNFVGAGVTVTGGTTATVTIPGGSGSFDFGINAAMSGMNVF